MPPLNDRNVSDEEREVVRWLLANCALKDVSEYRVETLDAARVVPGCTCGCASIDFVFDGAAVDPTADPIVHRATNILAEAIALWPDGSQAGVMLWGVAGTLLGIELYELGGGALTRFPKTEMLRRWEDHFPADS